MAAYFLGARRLLFSRHGDAFREYWRPEMAAWSLSIFRAFDAVPGRMNAFSARGERIILMRRDLR